MENNFLSIKDITEILDVSRPAINDWLNDGRLEYCKPGNMRRVRPEHLINYLESLGNSLMAMAGFKRDIANYLWLKYRDEKYLKEVETQSELFKQYAAQKARAIK